MSIESLIIAAMSLLPTVQYSQRPPDAAEQIGRSKEEAVAYVTAMLIHDQSIRGLEWYQEVSRKNKIDSPLEVVQTAREGFDELGRSYQHWVVMFPQDDGTIIPWRPSFTSNGVIVTAFDPANPESLVRFPDPEPTGYPTPPLLLGRYIEATGAHRLGELLLQAESLLIEIPIDPNGIVRVGAILTANHVVTRVHVDIDTKRSFAPVRIEVNDILSGVPLEVLSVTRFERYTASHAPLQCDECDQAIWIPVEGRRETYTIQETDENRARFGVLRALLDKSGVNANGVKPLETATQAAYQNAIREAFGEAGVPYVPLAPSLHLQKIVVFNLNTPIHESAFSSTNIVSRPQSNLILNIKRDGKPFDDPDADLEEQDRMKSDVPVRQRLDSPKRTPTAKE